MSNTFRFLSGHDNWQLGALFFRRTGEWTYHVVETVPRRIAQAFESRLYSVDLSNMNDLAELSEHSGWNLQVLTHWRIRDRRTGALFALGEDSVRAMLVDRMVRSKAAPRIGTYHSNSFDEVRKLARVDSIRRTSDGGFTRCPSCGEPECPPGCEG